MKNIIIGHLNINSLRNKFHDLAELMKGNLDILVVTETKLDHTFPEKQFLIPGYKKPFRADRNKDGGGVMVFVREDIPILAPMSLNEMTLARLTRSRDVIRRGLISTIRR